MMMSCSQSLSSAEIFSTGTLMVLFPQFLHHCPHDLALACPNLQKEKHTLSYWELFQVCSTILTVVGYGEVTEKWRSVFLRALNLRKCKGFSPLLCTWAALSKEKGQQTYMKYKQIQARDGRAVREVTSVAAGQRNTLSNCRETQEVSFCNRLATVRECL